jgi:phenylpropionate dioxygenase-like ring-hydroxylating dioxygenase large terminal subunit
MDDTSEVGVADAFALESERDHPGIYVGDVLRADGDDPPATLLERSEANLGTEPIPASRYYSREFAELEREKLWSRVWQFACWAQDIPNPGDIYVYRILGQSVLIVRQQDGSLKAFRNACLHRGRELCEAKTNQTQLRCPYHFFTWGLDGDLKWVPSHWDFPHVGDDFRLPEVRIGTWNGFVFVNFDEKAPPLQQYLGRIVGEWKDWSFENRYKAMHVRKRINCNWKTGQDAFIEGFHSFASHPQFVTSVPDDCIQVDTYDDDPHISRMITVTGIPSPRLRPQPSAQDVVDAMAADYMPDAIGTPEGKIREGETARKAVARLARASYQKNFGIDSSKLSTSEAIDPVSYFVFPNLMPWPTLAFPLVYNFIPDEKDPEWCTWDTMLFFPFVGDRPPSAPIVEVGPNDSFETVPGIGKMGLVADQDGEQLEAVQRGMHNLASGQLTLTRYQEARIRHYHRTLESYLGL